LPRSRVWLALLLAGCAQQPVVEPKPAEERPGELPALPATFVNTPGCPRCLAVTLTLRPDGSYLVRERLGESEFYDFGRWRRAGDALELVGGRDAPRRYALRGEALDSQPGTQGGDLKRAPKPEALRGPFRMEGLYDGESFRECRTGVAWRFAETRAAEALRQQYLKRAEKPALVALDAQFEGAPELLRVLRPATLLNARACPG
jgi:hypothetical protein